MESFRQYQHQIELLYQTASADIGNDSWREMVSVKYSYITNMYIIFYKLIRQPFSSFTYISHTQFCHGQNSAQPATCKAAPTIKSACLRSTTLLLSFIASPSDLKNTRFCPTLICFLLECTQLLPKAFTYQPQITSKTYSQSSYCLYKHF